MNDITESETGEACIVGDRDAEREIARTERKPKSVKKLEKRLLARGRRREKQRVTKRLSRQQERLARRLFLHDLSAEDRERFLQEERERQDRERHALEKHLEESYTSGIRLAFNLGFSDSMSMPETMSLAKQLSYSYLALKNCRDVKLQFHLTSLRELEPLWERCCVFGAQRWKVHKHTAAYFDVFPRDEIIVLTPDAQETLTSLDPTKVYVIGGLVDRTVTKFQSLSEAEEMKIKTCKLPFREYIPDHKGTVLNVNTVVEVLIDFLQNVDWANALRTAVPARKQTSLGRLGRRRVREESMPDDDDDDDDAKDDNCSNSMSVV